MKPIKKISLLGLLFLKLLNPSNAQKIVSVPIDVYFIQLPTDSLPRWIKTYDIENNKLTTNLGNTLQLNTDSNFINLPGYSHVESNGDLSITVQVEKGISYGNPKHRKKVKTDIEKKPGTLLKSISGGLNFRNVALNTDYHELMYTEHSYAIPFSTPSFRLKAISSNNDTIMPDSLFGNIQDTAFFGVSSSEKEAYKSTYELQIGWQKEKEQFLKQTESTTFDLFNSIQLFLSTYCLHWKHLETTLFVPEGKKNRYSDYQDALSLAIDGLSYLRYEQVGDQFEWQRIRYNDFTETLMQAVVIWEKALEEKDFEKKKARVNQKVTQATYLNLTTVYIWLDAFKRAEKCLAEYQLIASKKELESPEYIQLKNFLSDRKMRFEANLWRGKQLDSQPD